MIYDISTLYPIHQYIISHIKLNISANTSTVLLSSHTDFRSYNPHCMYDNTGTIYMTSCEYIWHRINSLWYHITLWHSHTLYSRHHAQDTCHRIHCIWAITYSLLIIACLKYVWYQTTTVCMSWHALCLWHPMYYYDVTILCVWLPKLYTWLETR